MDLELHLVVIYIGYCSVVDSLQWTIESTLELDSEGPSTSISSNGSRSELINHDDMVYELALGSFLCIIVSYNYTRLQNGQ